MSNAITITRQDGYRFLIDFGPGMAPTTSDEPPPLGKAAGPSPSQLVAAAAANCLSASLVFALSRLKEDPGALTATATWETGRNENNRLRLRKIDVVLTLGDTAAAADKIADALARFEDFCTVSQSIRSGIPIGVTVKSADGSVLK